EAFAERPRPACDLLSSAAQTPLRSAQFLIGRCEGTECHAPRIDARERLGGIGGALRTRPRARRELARTDRGRWPAPAARAGGARLSLTAAVPPAGPGQGGRRP